MRAERERERVQASVYIRQARHTQLGSVEVTLLTKVAYVPGQSDPRHVFSHPMKKSPKMAEKTLS